MMLNHLGGGPGGIEHFLHQFAGPMSDVVEDARFARAHSEVQKRLIDGVRVEVGTCTIEELEAERDEICFGLTRAAH